MTSPTSSTKSLMGINNNFFSKQWHFFEDNTCNYLPKYYEQELPLLTEQKITFRTVSPKAYYVGEPYTVPNDGLDNGSDHVEVIDDWEDDLDALYEATLLSSGFLESLARQHEEDSDGLKEEAYGEDRPLNRLRQILEHLNPSAVLTSPASIAVIDKHQQREMKGKGKL